MTVVSQLFYDPAPAPTYQGSPLPLGYYNFYLSGTTTPAPVYQDSALTTPYPTNASGQYVVTADGTGKFQPIFLNPALVYRVQLYNAQNQLLRDDDPIVPSFPYFGTGPISLNAFGEVTINAPSPGGTGVTLTVTPGSGNALKLNAVSVGSPAIIANNTVTTGTQTATFTATNKPGGATTSPSKWLPISCDGSTYYLPLWA